MKRFPTLLAVLSLTFSTVALAEKESQEVPARTLDGERSLAHKVFSQDGKFFAGYYREGFDEVISIHEAKTGKQIRKIVGHGDDVRELKFTPDGEILASRCENRNRKGWALWNVDSGELILRLPVPSE